MTETQDDINAYVNVNIGNMTYNAVNQTSLLSPTDFNILVVRYKLKLSKV